MNWRKGVRQRKQAAAKLPVIRHGLKIAGKNLLYRTVVPLRGAVRAYFVSCTQGRKLNECVPGAACDEPYRIGANRPARDGFHLVFVSTQILQQRMPEQKLFRC